MSEKKEWQKPELIVILKGNDNGNVLGACENPSVPCSENNAARNGTSK
ncbi:MAG: hypothetical protein ABIJ59_12115 [Pseudomonadota bacterium]